jgi:hypothetical protein
MIGINAICLILEIAKYKDMAESQIQKTTTKYLFMVMSYWDILRYIA